MPREELYLQDIIQSANAIGRFLEGVSKENFLADELLQSAILHKLAIIGEAAAQISKELKSRHPEVEWKAIIGFRNIVIHAYFSIIWEIVWTTATEDVPMLSRQIQLILESDFPDFELKPNS
ncbi:MAG TPA: DUF86 domain-containing protein [Pyrinomonadaceae bacterium]|nr:DUF86 domain-containing protein [Pyrinomonadaceae bacterium]